MSITHRMFNHAQQALDALVDQLDAEVKDNDTLKSLPDQVGELLVKLDTLHHDYTDAITLDELASLGD